MLHSHWFNRAKNTNDWTSWSVSVHEVMVREPAVAQSVLSVVFVGRVDLNEVDFRIFEFDVIDRFIKIDGGGGDNGRLRFWRGALAKFIVIKFVFSRSKTNLT